MLNILADEAEGWDAERLQLQISEELEQYGISVQDSTVLVEPEGCSVHTPSSRACERGTRCCVVTHNPRICPNCGEPDQHDDHWDLGDGPNRGFWGCQKVGMLP